MSRHDQPYVVPFFNEASAINGTFSWIPRIQHGLGALAATAGIAFAVAHGTEGKPAEVVRDITAAAMGVTAVAAGSSRGWSLHNTNHVVIATRSANTIEWSRIHKSGLYKRQGWTTRNIHKVKGSHPIFGGMVATVGVACDGVAPVLLIGAAKGVNFEKIPSTVTEAAGGAAALIMAGAYHGFLGNRNANQRRKVARQLQFAHNVKNEEHKRIAGQSRPWRPNNR